MRVIVFVFLNPESPVLFLEFDGNEHIRIFPVRVVRIVLDIPARKFASLISEPSLSVYQGQASDTILLCGAKIVGTKARCNVHDTGTIFRADEVCRYYPEGIAAFRLGIGH